DTVAQKISAAPCDRAAAERDLAFLLQPAVGETPDFQSARQLAWAAKIIATELALTEPKFGPKADAETPEQAKVRRQNDVKVYDAWIAGAKVEAERKVNAAFERGGLNERLKLL